MVEMVSLTDAVSSENASNRAAWWLAKTLDVDETHGTEIPHLDVCRDESWQMRKSRLTETWPTSF